MRVVVPCVYARILQILSGEVLLPLSAPTLRLIWDLMWGFSSQICRIECWSWGSLPSSLRAVTVWKNSRGMGDESTLENRGGGILFFFEEEGLKIRGKPIRSLLWLAPSTLRRAACCFQAQKPWGSWSL